MPAKDWNRSQTLALLGATTRAIRKGRSSRVANPMARVLNPENQPGRSLMNTPLRTILLIEADAAVCDGLKTVLTLNGFDVVAALTAPEALRLLRTCRPALVLLDDDVCGGGHGRLVREISRRFPEAPIVVTSTDARRETLVLRSGATCFFSKPIYPEALLKTMNLLLPSSSLADEPVAQPLALQK